MTSLKSCLKTIAAALFWLAVWEVLALHIAKPLLLPAPTTVLTRLGALALTSGFWLAVLATLCRIVAGVIIGIFSGALLAVLTACVKPLHALFAPLLTMIKSTPVVSFIILVLIWAGRDVVPVIIVVLMVLPVVWANISAGISGVDRQLLELAGVYRLSRGAVLKSIYVPSVMPHFLSACRSALGLAWKAGVAAEVLTVPLLSIGRNLYESKLYMETVDTFAWTVMVVICSLLIEKSLTGIFTRLAGRYKGAER